MLTTLPNGRTLLNIVGPATIAQAEDLRDHLVQAVTTLARLDVDFDGSEVDVSIIQLLLSARKSLRERGGDLRLARRPDGPLLEALTRGGFTHSLARDEIWRSADEDNTHRR